MKLNTKILISEKALNLKNDLLMSIKYLFPK